MSARQARCWSCCVVVCLALAAPVLAVDYSVFKNGVPDVNKNPWPPNPADQSCWQACAANLLAGAGWGLAANNAQQNGNAIYGQMTAHFGKANQGAAELAINWWLYNYGLNSNQALQGWYRPELTYNDVTARGRQLKNLDYDFLLDELKRCQYVGVKWQLPANDHCITLVGGNYSNAAAPNGVSVWHDSDRNNVLPGDDVYTNAFDGQGNWTLPNYPTVGATGYVTLCPGLQKSDSAMRNYDAAWYTDQLLNGNWQTTWRVAGTANYGQPMWLQDGDQKYTILQVPNETIPDKQKEVWLVVDFRDRFYAGLGALDPPDILLKDPFGHVIGDRDTDVDADGGLIRYHWVMPDQPDFECIVFPNEDYYTLAHDVKDFDIATECVPEPATLGLLALGLAGILRRRR